MFEQPSLRQKSQERNAQPPVLSNYLDYRLYLKDYYNHRRLESKASLRPYSYSNFSAAAGIKSPNYLKMIIEGKRNLSDEMAIKFAKAMRFQKLQTAEFQALVHYTQATESSARNQYLRELADIRVQQKLDAGEIDQNTWDKIPGWVAYVLHAMIPSHGINGDVESLLRQFRGKALSQEVQVALEAMLRSGLIEKNADDGRLFKKAEFMDDLTQISPALIRKLQSELMYLGLESLFRDQPQEREMGSLTVSLSEKEFEEIKFQLRKMRKSLMRDNLTKVERAKKERVYQINLQLYPLTDWIENEKSSN